MKKIIILSLCLISITILKSSAQPYQSIFADTGSTEWVFTWGNTFGRINDTAYVEKDTTLNGITYKKIVTRKGQFYWGLLRENLDSGKVWYRDYPCGSTPDTTEKLVFDFSLNVGDTFKAELHNMYSYGDPDKIVDSIKVIGGLKYIYFRAKDFTYDDEPFTFIEGVGSNLGIITNACTGSVMGYRYLLCSYKDGQQTSYKNKYYNGVCWKFNLIKEEGKQNPNIVIFPQPASHILYIRSPNFTITHIEIINSLGKVVSEISQANITSVDVSHLGQGYYHSKLHTLEGRTIIKPIIIHK